MSLGLDADSFWTKTSPEMSAIMAGVAERLEREHDERMSLAWHIAALMRTDPKKRLPRLQTLLSKKASASSVRQTWQQQMGIMDMWVARTRRIAAAEKRKSK